MLGSSVDKLFERYRRRGDAAALAKVFDATAPELFRLAQHLVRDPLEAEDVLQDTFVTAIDAAQRWDADRPLVPWLTGILARKASEARRKARRTLEPDRLSERGEPDPADLVADSELSVEIVQAIEALPELYRAVLLRHLLDGARPAEIARDLGRAPGTVRMQIHRGLEQLRRALPAGFAAGAALAALSPRGLGAVKEAVLAHAATAAAAGGAVATATAVKATSSALGKLVGGGLLAVLVAVVATVAWRARSDGPAPVAAPGPGPAVSADASSPALAEPAASGASREADSVAVPPRGPRVRLVGTVTGVGPDELDDTRIEVRGVARYRWPEERTLRTRPSADGRFEVVLDPVLAFAGTRGPLSEIAVRAVHKAYLADGALLDLASATPVAAAASDSLGFELACALDLRPAALVHGEVRDADGPRAGVEVALVRTLDEVPQRGEIDRVLSDADGRYVLQAGEAGEYGVLALESGFVPAFALLTVRAAWPAEVPALLLEQGRTLRGRVTDGGRPVAGAEVRCWRGPDSGEVAIAGHRLVPTGGRVSWTDLSATTDGEGLFELPGLAWEPQALGVVLAGPDLRYLRPLPTLELGALEESVEIELSAARVELEVVDADGALLDGWVWWEDGLEVGGAPPVPVRAGRVDFAVLAGLELSLSVDSPASDDALLEVGPLQPGQVHRERVVLQPAAKGGAVSLDVTSPASQLEYVTVHFGAGSGGARRVDLEGGHALVDDTPTGPVTLELFANGAWRHYEDLLLPSRFELELATNQSGKGLRVDFERGGRLRLRVTDLAGQLLPARCTLRDLYAAEQDVRFLLRSPDEQALAPGERLSDRGPSDVYPNLAPGVYEVELAIEGRESRVLPVRIAAGEVTELEVVLP
jgi:RNA polymerase sigma-70 factor (ECF subfamily)